MLELTGMFSNIYLCSLDIIHKSYGWEFDKTNVCQGPLIQNKAEVIFLPVPHWFPKRIALAIVHVAISSYTHKSLKDGLTDRHHTQQVMQRV